MAMAMASLLPFLLLLFAFLRPSLSRLPPVSNILHDDTLFPNGTGVTRASFPDDFLFGSITSSMKHEGAQYVDGKSDNIWDTFADNDGATLDGAIPGQCGDNYNRYKEDHELVTGLGMNAYRLSIAWSRIYPNGTGVANEIAIAHYNDVIDDVLDQGLELFVTLWTQDHPQILQDAYGGAMDSQFIDDFAAYADTCFEAFGDRVKYWITFDEPNDWAGLGYATNQNPPGRCTSGIKGYGDCSEGDSGTEPYIAGHHLLLAHAEAAEIYRNKYQATQNGSIGMALWHRWYEPLTNTTADVEAAQRATDFLLGWFLDPIFAGNYPDSMRTIVGSRLPEFTEAQLSKLNGSIDFIGINVVTAFYAYDYNFSADYNVTSYYLDPGAATTGYRDGEVIGVGDHDWAVPWCIRKTVEYVKVRYDNFPVYIAQTGWGILDSSVDETLEDDQRVEYFQTYYAELSKAIEDGANVKGVFAWSLIDGFEFNLGLGIRVGIHYVDNQMKRYPRKSALWFKEMLATNTSSNLVS